MNYQNFSIIYKKKSSKAFTLPELLVASSISLVVLTAGYYLAKVVLEANKADQTRINLYSRIDNALDFVVDEVNSGKRILYDLNDFPKNKSCKKPLKDQFLIGIQLPYQASESSSYLSESGEGNSWNEVNCPIVYSLKKDLTYSGREGSYQLWRNGPKINEKGFYTSVNFSDSIITDKIRYAPIDPMPCQKGWFMKTVKGIAICTDPNKKYVELSISAEVKKFNGKYQFTSKSSGAFSRIQDGDFRGEVNTRSSKSESSKVCISPPCSVYGTNITKKNITFIIDESASMGCRYRWCLIQGKTRIESAKLQLIKAIIGLNEDVKIQVIAFGSRDRYLWRSGPRVATKSNKLLAIKWISRIRAYQQSTNPWKSLSNTIKDQNVGQIIILSDGVPNNYRGYCRTSNGDQYNYPQDACISEANENRANNSIPVQIDTISIGYNACNHWYNDYNWMGRLASSNNGKCTLVR